jgi:hypothetical protein
MPGAFLEPRESLFEEPFAPLRDDFPTGIQVRSDLIVTVSLGREQNDLGSHHVSIR